MDSRRTHQVAAVISLNHSGLFFHSIFPHSTHTIQHIARFSKCNFPCFVYGSPNDLYGKCKNAIRFSQLWDIPFALLRLIKHIDQFKLQKPRNDCFSILFTKKYIFIGLDFHGRQGELKETFNDVAILNVLQQILKNPNHLRPKLSILIYVYRCFM